MANISEAPRYNNPALAAFAQKMAQARGGVNTQIPTPQSAPLISAEPAVKEPMATATMAKTATKDPVDETNQKPEGAFVRKGMFLDIRV